MSLQDHVAFRSLHERIIMRFNPEQLSVEDLVKVKHASSGLLDLMLKLADNVGNKMAMNDFIGILTGQAKVKTQIKG